MSASLSPIAASINVAIGGAIGAVLRYQLGRGMTGWLGAPIVGAFPFATLAANAIGSLLMGVLAGWLARHGGEGGVAPDQLRLLLGVGLLGGFTTFSAFSLDVLYLIERGRNAAALGYVSASVLLSVLGLYMGLTLARVWMQ